MLGLPLTCTTKRRKVLVVKGKRKKEKFSTSGEGERPSRNGVSYGKDNDE